MNKFLVLLKKEIRELLTLQIIVPLLAVSLIFVFIGRVVSSAKGSSENQVVGVVDQDHTAASQTVKTILGKSGFTVRDYSGSVDAAIADTEANNGTEVVLIPSGFGASLEKLPALPLSSYTILHNFSAAGLSHLATFSSALTTLNDAFRAQLVTSRTTLNPAVVKNPITTTDYVQIGNRRAPGNPAALASFASQQFTFIPIILFFILIFASQIIASTIASEKENKTLETLLSLPVSRRSIIFAKMLAAGLFAGLSSLIYLYGYQRYLLNATSDTNNSAIHDLAARLGLVFTPSDYVLMGVTLFGAILIALVAALILGAFAEDVKSVQGLLMPLLLLAIIPYVLSLALDINSVSAPVRWLVYAIPFSHAFLAPPNLILHNFSAIGWGIAYEAVFFAICFAIAVRIFSTDWIVTMKLSLRRSRSQVAKRI
ncbi:ABC transporter permease [Patescibacteria group bacterium]|nr:ABC transporter permease [Patescibacteria group bacterium]